MSKELKARQKTQTLNKIQQNFFPKNAENNLYKVNEKSSSNQQQEKLVKIS